MEEIAGICAKLRRWPHVVMPDQRTLVRECLERSSELLDCTKAILVLEEGEEPWVIIATTAGGEFTWQEEENLDFDSVVLPDLIERGFLLDDSRLEARRLHIAGEDETLVDAAIHPVVVARLGAERVLSLPILSESVRARMFLCNPQASVDASLLIAEPLGILIGQRFEASAQIRIAVRDTVEQDRMRVARDLHDGLLQSFTGVVLQLETIHTMIDEQPDEARRIITETQGIIMSDQRELRRFVEQLRPRGPRREAAFDFTARLEDLRLRFANQWKIGVVYDVENVDPLVSTFLGQETFRLIHEAVTNSAKHGGASDVRVKLRTVGSEMHIQVADNGTGFSFHGKLTLEQMRESANGPRVLAERVASLNGSLIVESTENGATVSISVPLGWGGP